MVAGLDRQTLSLHEVARVFVASASWGFAKAGGTKVVRVDFVMSVSRVIQGL